MSHANGEFFIARNRLYIFQSQPLIFMIQGCRKHVERKEGYELQVVMEMVTSCQWNGTMLMLKSQQLVMKHHYQRHEIFIFD